MLKTEIAYALIDSVDKNSCHTSLKMQALSVSLLR